MRCSAGSATRPQRDGTLLRAHALRSTVNQAAVFGSPFVGLLLFRFGGAAAVLVGICVLLAAATVILGVVPELERESEPIAVMRENVAVGIASLRLNTRLRTIGWANLSWNVFAGAAIGIMPAVLREHLGMNEVMASATFIAGAVVVVLLTLPLVRTAQRRYGAVRTFIVAITIQATAIVLFADPRGAVVGPLVYCVFLLANSAAAASLNGARAAEVEHDHQGLLNMALLTVGMIGFIAGVVLAAGLLGPLGFGVVLALIAVGMATTARGLPPAADRRMTALDLLIRGATVYPGDAPPFEGDVGVSGGAISLVTPCRRGFGAAGGARGRGRARADAVPGLHRPAHALRAASRSTTRS